MDINRYQNCNPCRIDLGVVGGNTVSLYKGNMTDLDSDLRGLGRHNTHCPAGQFLPGTVVQGIDSYFQGSADGKSTKLHHLPECKIVKFPTRPKTAGPQPDNGCHKPRGARRHPLYPNEWNGTRTTAWANY